jgi:hypothetical protein
MFVTDLGGHLWVVHVDFPREAKLIFKSKGMLTGIALLNG